ncbi:homoserine kinase [Aquibacillus koreensis]|uniref:Homoserine kinase n=1 Tax=Aquibacillus koreensis TaxID=279446 RepID=A0A9X4AHP8_9BACI|nr:homoserine kinase [Aquibacillus koreensis]MCT2535881.1 homoserine kinase [Aquibacillus koreensis]MDC3420337.1 homoserine kinase [Aquibacillus koreensis]
MSWVIRVPSSTSNLGAGFDSIGLALNLYLDLKVNRSDEWEFVPASECLMGIPTGKENLVYQIAIETALQFGYNELPACKVEMKSDIPLARGLGSSATATIAGIELANLLLELELSAEEKLEIATKIEGHPDNVAPSLMGGCVIGHFDYEVNWTKAAIRDITFLAIVPNFELKTKEARAVLPANFQYQESVHASSIANVSTAAICQGNWELLGKMMKKDLFHQPYRKPLVPHYDKLEAYLEHDVYGTFLSGAGPTMIAIVDNQVVKERLADWENAYPEFEWLPLQVENEGLVTMKLNVSY